MPNAQSILLITANYLESLQTRFQIDAAGSNPDIYIVQDTTLGIDQIRQLKRFTLVPPFKSTKWVIIPNFHTATLEAQNAMLKLLEEPPSYLMLILITPSQSAIIDTVISRCQIIHDCSLPEALPHEQLLKQLIARKPANRISCIPTETKSKQEAIAWCHQLITEAREYLYQSPGDEAVTNVSILSRCLQSLEKNANPTIAIINAILELKPN